MSTEFQEIQWTQQEQAFIDRFLGNYQPNNYDLYLDLIQTVLDRQINKGLDLCDPSIKSLTDGIYLAIFDYRAGQAIESMLSDPSYIIKNPPNTRRMSTKAESYQRFLDDNDLTQIHHCILSTLDECPAMSRTQISNHTGIRLQTICARVNELIKLGKIRVEGTIKDGGSHRNVETLVKA